MKKAVLIVILGILVSLTACNAKVAEEVSCQEYHSALAYLTVNLPDDWAAVEGPEVLLSFQGQVAFNSWGEEGFWAQVVSTGNSLFYSPQGVMSQVPEGGAYVALIIAGGPSPRGNDPPEYTQADLGGLFEPHDWRQDSATEAQLIKVYKWGKGLHIEVACHPEASDQTLAELNALLASWRFDAIPEGDAEWMGLQARALLPESVEPFMFGNRARIFGNNEEKWITEVETKKTTMIFRFIYQWDSSRHWWEIEVTPAGEATLTGEGGDPLPF